MTDPILPDPVNPDPAATAVECPAQTLEHLRDSAIELAGDAKDRAKAVGKQLVDTVRTHPVHTAVAAVGAGLLVWWLLSRRK